MLWRRLTNGRGLREERGYPQKDVDRQVAEKGPTENSQHPGIELAPLAAPARPDVDDAEDGENHTAEGDDCQQGADVHL